MTEIPASASKIIAEVGAIVDRATSEWFKQQRELLRRKSMAREIVRQQLRIRHDDMPIERASQIAVWVDLMIDKYGPFNPAWMARETERQRPLVDAAMRQQRQFRHLDAGWDGKSPLPSEIAMIGEAMRAAFRSDQHRTGEGLATGERTHRTEGNPR